MALNPRKVNALVQEEKKKARKGAMGGGASEEEDDDEEDEGGEGGDDKGGGDGEGKAKKLAEKALARIKSGNPDEKLMAIVDGYEPSEDGDYPEGVEDEDVWDEARKAVEGIEHDEGQEWAIVVHVYKGLGGKLAGDDGGGDDDGAADDGDGGDEDMSGEAEE